MRRLFEEETAVTIASVDTDRYGDLGSKYDVSGFPTLKMFAFDKVAESYSAE